MELKDYLESTDAAAKRTRTFIVVLAVACVLGSAGFLNSLPIGWIHQRLASAAHEPNYAAMRTGYISSLDEEVPANLKDRCDRACEQFTNNLIRSYVENSFTIRVPFFGFSFDVNDLGLLSGVAFMVVLTILQYCLKSEIVALLVGFEAADRAQQLAEYYDVLASRQVFTTPSLEIGGEYLTASRITAYLPRGILFLPILVYGAILGNDFASILVGMRISPWHTKILVGYTIVFMVCILWLVNRCWRDWKKIDAIWDARWKQLAPQQRQQVSQFVL